jgi:hypothetical protein
VVGISRNTQKERDMLFKRETYNLTGCPGSPTLMSITRNLLICVWNILRYSLRIWDGKQKTHDIEKVAHYAELAWTMSDGKVIKTDS